MPLQTDHCCDNDAQLMASLQENNISALGQLYDRYAMFVKHVIAATVPESSKEDIDDLCHDIFLEIHKSAANYKESGRFRAWIYGITVRIAKNKKRKFAIRRRLYKLFIQQSKNESATLASSEESSLMINKYLPQILKKMSSIERQTLILFELEGLKGQEIADLTGLNLNTVWTHLRHARQKLLSIKEIKEVIHE